MIKKKLLLTTASMVAWTLAATPITQEQLIEPSISQSGIEGLEKVLVTTSITSSQKDFRSEEDIVLMSKDRFSILSLEEEQELLREQEKNSRCREITIICSFYTSLAGENGGYAGRTADNGYLKATSIAAPKDVPFGTIIEIDGYGEKIVDDRGSSKHIRWVDTDTLRADVYVPREDGEGDDAYYERVNDMGKVTTVARIYTQ